MDLEDYKPRHNNYAPLREAHQEQALGEEPTRPETHYGERYAQGQGDYVSETTAARQNDRMINSEYYAAAQGNSSDRSEPKLEKAEQTDEKKNVYQELAQEVKEQQKQDSPDRQQERQAELGD
jgi:hypothetical protein